MTDLYPAIDLRAGKVVRLAQGDFERQTVYGDDPVEVASRFADAGARWVHVVDLDAARSGEATNRAIVAAVACALAGRANVQAGGGVRSVADAEELAAAGVARVVMGSVALEHPGVVAEVAAVVPVAVGLDHRDGRLAMRGWTHDSGARLADALGWFPDADAFVVTDIDRDGMLGGPDLGGLRAVAAVAPAPVIASGGVAGIDDVLALAGIENISGVIAGRAIYEGRFGVAAALRALAGDPP